MNIAEKLTALRVRAGLSRDKLAKRAGFGRGTALQRYEDPDYMMSRKLPVELAQKLSLALVGLGEPPIKKAEIWELAEQGGSIVISGVAVTAIPVFQWEKLKAGGEMLKLMPRTDAVEVAGLLPSDYVAARVVDDHCERIAPKGAFVIIDLSDSELRDGRRYVVVLDGVTSLRRYQVNPERWESEAAFPVAAIYPREAIQIIGRAVRTLNEI